MINYASINLKSSQKRHQEETLVKGIKNKEKKPYNAVVKIGEKND
jgi:hypothetical protein